MVPRRPITADLFRRIRRQHVLTTVGVGRSLMPWTSSLQPASTASPTMTCSMQFDTTGERSRPTIQTSRCSSDIPSRRAFGSWGGRRRRRSFRHPRDAGKGEVLEGVVDTMSATRAQRSKALERWADKVDPADLVVANTESLRTIAELAERRGELDAALVEAVRSARRADRSWTEIGAMLGVTKQAAQRKYAKVAV